ncbi:cupin-like domain-containing protein [Asticcacaulis solisilvae]|uniref:cupin-like domain-containing protein n=1 Tax=Asticcacaulis solisilvae TaxID=1217274 RepID=UPI003FD8C985
MTFPAVELRDAVDAETFAREIASGGRPVLLKGQVAGWPAVRAAAESPARLAGYLKRFDAGVQVPMGLGSPENHGRFFYTADLKGLNFRTLPEYLPRALDWLVAHQEQPGQPSVYLQALPAERALPGFRADNPLGLVDHLAEPRVWLSNSVRVQTHFDPSYNLACLVAGRRRFTLFPPDQTPNLYPGPFDLTPGGVPVSMADLDEPDLERHPRFAEALKTAVVAELEPGDALFIPYMWWHHVSSDRDFNMLVNYWWTGVPDAVPSPYVGLSAALMSIRMLPADQRAAWKTIFDTYVFEAHGDPVAHLPETAQGSLARLTPEGLSRFKQQFKTTVKGMA